MKRLWQLTTVFISAQIAVSPISIYYFYQFPSLFLLSNLIILPFFGIFLSFSLAVLLSIVFGISIPILFQFYENWVTLLNKIVFWVAQQEAFLFENLYSSITSTILVYCIVISGVFYLYRKTFFKSVWCLLFVFVFISNLVFETQKENKVNIFWIFHKHNESLIGHQKGGVFYYNTSDEEKTNRMLMDFKNSRVLKAIKKLDLKNSYVQDDFKLLLFKKEPILKIKELAPSHILLQKNVKLNLDLLFETFKPKLLISDGSNAPWFVERWKKTCEKYKVDFYDTREKGVLKINLENGE